MSKSHSGKKIAGLLRLLVAVVLFTVVLYLVPIRDTLVWEGEFPNLELVGKIEHREGELAFLSEDPERGGSLEIALRDSSKDGLWDAVTLTREGGSPESRALRPEEQTQLEEQPVEGLITTFRNMSPGPALIALLLYLAAAALSFVRWHRLLHAVQVKAGFWRAQRLGFFGLFFSNIIPGMTGGDLVKAIYVARDHPQQRAEAVFSVLVDRAIGLFGLALLAATILLFKLDEFGNVAGLVFGLVAAMVACSCLLFSRRLRRLVRFEQIVARLPGAQLLQKVDHAVLLYRDALGAIVVAVGMSLVVHGLVLTAIGMVGVALDLSLDSFLHYYALAPLPLIIQSVPIAPAGIGVGEAAFVYFFSTSTQVVAAPRALALALSYRAVQLVISMIGGVLLLLGGEKRVTAQEMEDSEDAAETPESETVPSGE